MENLFGKTYKFLMKGLITRKGRLLDKIGDFFKVESEFIDISLFRKPIFQKFYRITYLNIRYIEKMESDIKTF